MDGSQAANATPGGGVRVAAAAGGGAAVFDLAAFKSVMDDSIRSAIATATAPLHAELGALRERVDLSDAIAASREDSGGNRSDVPV